MQTAASMDIQKKQYHHMAEAGAGNREAAPIQLLFERLAYAIDAAHNGMSVLADKLAPVSAPAGTGVSPGAEDARAMPPSAMEQQLVSLLESVERLNRRIANAHDELRI